MKKAVRYSIATATALTLACVTFAHAELTNDAGLAFWELADERSQIDAEHERHQRLEQLSNIVSRRIEIKDALIHDLLEERKQFADVVEEFLYLNQQMPDLMAAIRLSFAGKTDREKMANNVLQFVKISLSKLPEKSETFERLQKACENYVAGL